MLIRQTILYLPAQVLGPLVQLAAMVIWTHFLVPGEMGLFALIVAAQELIYSATLFWFSLATVRYHDHLSDEGTQANFLNSESAVLLATTAAAALLVLTLPFVISGTWSVALIAATIIYVVTRGMVAHVSDRARAAHDTLTYSLVQICWPTVGLIAGLIFVSTIDANAAWVLLGYACGQVLALLIAAGRLRFGLAPLSFDPAVISQALRYGLPLVAGAILVWVAQNSLRFLVEWQQGAVAVGLVTVGWGLGLRVSAFASMLVTAAAFPLAVKRSRESSLDAGQAQLQQNGILLLAAVAPACAGLWLISDAFVELTVAAAFQDMTKAVLPWAIGAGALRSVRLHFGEQVFLLRERTVVPLVNDFIDALLVTIGTLVGLSAGGLEAAVIGATIGTCVSTIITLVWAWVAHAFTLPAWDSLKIAAATVVMALAVWAVPITPTLLGLAVPIAVGAVVYGLILALTYPEMRSHAYRIFQGRDAGPAGDGERIHSE